MGKEKINCNDDKYLDMDSKEILLKCEPFDLNLKINFSPAFTLLIDSSIEIFLHFAYTP